MASIRNSSGMQMLARSVLEIRKQGHSADMLAASSGARHLAHTAKVMEFVPCTQQCISTSTMQQSCAEVPCDDEFQEGHGWPCAAPRALIVRALQRGFIAVPRSGII